MNKQDQKCVWEYLLHLSTMVLVIAKGDYDQQAVINSCNEIGKNCTDKLKDFK